MIARRLLVGHFCRQAGRIREEPPGTQATSLGSGAESSKRSNYLDRSFDDNRI